MIACLYGRALTPFLESTIRDLCTAAAQPGDIVPLSVEQALADPSALESVRRLYVLPFDPPPEGSVTSLVRSLFPRTELLTSIAVQELCFDKIASQERLVERGVPVPETLITADPAELRDFVRRHELVMLKSRYGCAGYGHIVLWLEDGELLGDAGSHRYRMELTAGGSPQLLGEVLRYPAPYYAQRLIADIKPQGVKAGQLLRAYVVDGEVVFWTERYRERYVRPSDWIVSAGRGARYRFVMNVSAEVNKLALRAAEAVGARVAAVDLIRTSAAGPHVLEVNVDGYHMIIDRSFKLIPDYRDFFDLDQHIARLLLREEALPDVRIVGRPRPELPLEPAPRRDYRNRNPRPGPPRDRGPRPGPPRDRGPRPGPPRDGGPRPARFGTRNVGSPGTELEFAL